MHEKMNKEKTIVQTAEEAADRHDKMRTATKWRYFPTTSARKKNYDWADHKEGLMALFPIYKRTEEKKLRLGRPQRGTTRKKIKRNTCRRVAVTPLDAVEEKEGQKP